MSVLTVFKGDFRPGMDTAWAEYAKVNVPVLFGIPGVVELRGYRNIAGASQIIITYEFTDLAAYAAWRSHPEVERVSAESHTFFGEHFCGNLGSLTGDSRAAATGVG